MKNTPHGQTFIKITRKKLSRAVIARRQAKRQTIKELAAETGLDKRTIVAMELGWTNHRYDTMLYVLKALGITDAEIF